MVKKQPFEEGDRVLVFEKGEFVKGIIKRTMFGFYIKDEFFVSYVILTDDGKEIIPVHNADIELL